MTHYAHLKLNLLDFRELGFFLFRFPVRGVSRQCEVLIVLRISLNLLSERFSLKIY
jgi:hypothetical protein